MTTVYSEEGDGKELDIYWVSDLGLAAVLMLKGKTFMKVDTTNPGLAAFGFEKSPFLLAMVDEYYDKEVLVEPILFQGQLVSLKRRINQELNN